MFDFAMDLIKRPGAIIHWGNNNTGQMPRVYVFGGFSNQLQRQSI